MEELFEAVREACPAGTWSKGVELVRRFAVSGVSSSDEEVTCRVLVPERAVPFTVQVYPGDAEWDCDCQSRLPCCEHVAATVIALRKAQAEGKELPEGKTGSGRLVYRLGVERGQVSLHRVIVRGDGSEIPLKVNLASALVRGAAGASVQPSQHDLNIDRLLGAGAAGPIHRDRVASVMKLLSSARNVEFDGKPVHVLTEPLGPKVVVRDAVARDGGEGFEVVLERDPRIDEILAPGVARSGDNLHGLSGTDVAGLSFERLPDTKFYGKGEFVTLLTEVLPGLKQRFQVDVQTSRLPELTREERPRVVVDVEQEGDHLTAMALLVYGDPPIARIDNNRLVPLDGPIPVRDVEREQRAIEQARAALGITPGNRVFFEGRAALGFAEKLQGFRGEVRGSKGRTFIHHVTLSPELDTREGFRLAFSAKGESGNLEADPQATLSAWREGLSLVPLLGGGWAELPKTWLDQHGDTLLSLLSARGEIETHRPYTAPLLLELCRALDAPPPKELEEARALLAQDDSATPAPLPADLTAELRPYQRLGSSWLWRMKRLRLGATLADDMGLGKTLQTLAVLDGRTLIVAPTSVVHNWASEITKFRPALRVSSYYGKGRALDATADVTLTSYAVMRLDLETLGAVEWDAVVLDEAQVIKNPESQVAQAAFQLKGKFRLSLSGTPVENRLEELWSQLHFTNPGLLGGRSSFSETFATPIANGEPGAAARLRRRIAPFVLRREKKTVAKELPAKTESLLHCELSERERAVYQAIHATTQSEVLERLQAGGNVMQALEALLRLRQAACHPALVPGQVAETSSKIERLMLALEDAVADQHRCLVFSQWTSLLDLIEPHLDAGRISYVRLDGSTRDRKSVVDAFQADDGPSVMLLSLKAGGSGLNLTAADHVFLMDLWWNPAVEQQATDRAHRIGQDKPVFVYRLVAKDTVEEKILLLQAQKRSLSDAALAEADQAGSLSRDDLLMLLR
jgi:superfamily II DNA or RNA helicase